MLNDRELLEKAEKAGISVDDLYRACHLISERMESAIGKTLKIAVESRGKVLVSATEFIIQEIVLERIDSLAYIIEDYDND